MSALRSFELSCRAIAYFNCRICRDADASSCETLSSIASTAVANIPFTSEIVLTGVLKLETSAITWKM